MTRCNNLLRKDGLTLPLFPHLTLVFNCVARAKIRLHAEIFHKKKLNFSTKCVYIRGGRYQLTDRFFKSLPARLGSCLYLSIDMADSTSSSSTSAQPIPAPLVPASAQPYPENEVRELRAQGIEEERADKWEAAAETYSRALELAYV